LAVSCFRYVDFDKFISLGLAAYTYRQLFEAIRKFYDTLIITLDDIIEVMKHENSIYVKQALKLVNTGKNVYGIDVIGSDYTFETIVEYDIKEINEVKGHFYEMYVGT